MSWKDAPAPDCPNVAADAIENIIISRPRDLGGFSVRRVLPSPKRLLVGPFIFFDHAGPTEFIDNGGIDVRPHPHIGIATVTYLYAGEFLHRDSLGTNQMIYPGEVNWMIAGKGITHSERTSAETRATRHSLHGIQTWVALPESVEDTEPAFEHHGAGALPEIKQDGATLRLILGTAYGKRAPVKTFSEMFYVDAVLDAGAKLAMPDNHEERGAYIVEGSIELGGDQYESGRLLVFKPGDAITLCAGAQGARLMLLGGEKLGGPRHLWWNFVSSSREKIDAAKAAWKAQDWENGLFKLPPDDNEEFTPLPDR